MTEHFYAHGKLLLTGEYVVLDGALALGLPTRLGQHLRIDPLPNKQQQVIWESFQPDNTRWLYAELSLPDLHLQKTNDQGAGQRLQTILRKARTLAEGAFLSSGVHVRTHLEFDRKWGLGSSSTLLSMIAEWAKVDEYALAAATFGGSGYDLACARADGPLLYQKRNDRGHYVQIPFHPPFLRKLYFVYSGTKQDSRQGIRRYRSRAATLPTGAISALTLELAHTTDFSRFCALLLEHEAHIAALIGMEPVGKNRLADAPGVVKSLGAWGGDFLLLASEESTEVVRAYFEKSGFYPIFSYEELIQSPAGQTK